jgi:hypothetical protein
MRESFPAGNPSLVDTLLALSGELCLMARHTSIQDLMLTAMLFPKAHDYTPDLGKVRTNPEVIEQLCKLITELPEGQYQISHCNRLTRVCITMKRYLFLLGALFHC